MNNTLYTVSQLATICDVSSQTLRYYDKINLLKPTKIDENNNYRLYSDNDILTLRIIRDMKEIGFSLEEINDYLKVDNDDSSIDLLENKRNEYIDKLSSVNSILDKIISRIDKLKQTAANSLSDFSKTIEITQMPERVVAFTRYNSSCARETLAKRFYELDKFVKKENIEAFDSRFAVYHDFLNDFNPNDCDLELCLRVSDNYKGKNFVRTIDKGLYASGIYKGEYQGQSYYLVSWIKDHGYEIISPAVEIYINSFMNTKFPKNYVTQVQFPVKKC